MLGGDYLIFETSRVILDDPKLTLGFAVDGMSGVLLLHKWSKVEKRPKEFEIDMIRCIYCGMCEEVCPEQAIYLRKDYAITGHNREEMVHDKEKLYEIGGVHSTGTRESPREIS